MREGEGEGEGLPTNIERIDKIKPTMLDCIFLVRNGSVKVSGDSF